MNNKSTHLRLFNVRQYLTQWLFLMVILLPMQAYSAGPNETFPEMKGLEKQTNVTAPLHSKLVAEKKLPSTAFAHDLSPWGMFNHADWVVKAVMIGLAIASLATWAVLLAKSFEFIALKRLLRNTLDHLNRTHTLKDAEDNPDILGVAREFIEAAETEIGLSKDLGNREEGKAGLKERVASSVSRVQVASSRKMLTGTGLLATIGSVAPFVGLFGTVWGIMNSFIGIAQTNTTNLAVVAPGIAEALLATALGLVAAIPAVVIYNHFTRQIASAKALIADNSEAILRIVSRDLDREKSLQVVRRKTG